MTKPRTLSYVNSGAALAASLSRDSSSENEGPDDWWFIDWQQRDLFRASGCRLVEIKADLRGRAVRRQSRELSADLSRDGELRWRYLLACDSIGVCVEGSMP